MPAHGGDQAAQWFPWLQQVLLLCNWYMSAAKIVIRYPWQLIKDMTAIQNQSTKHCLFVCLFYLHVCLEVWRTTFLLFPGYYLYIEASSTQQSGATAVLSSPVLYNLLPSRACIFTLQYHMYGAHTGSLLVGVATSANWTATRRLWEVNGDHRNVWLSSPNLDLSLGAARTFKVCARAELERGHILHNNVSCPCDLD